MPDDKDAKTDKPRTKKAAEAAPPKAAKPTAKRAAEKPAAKKAAGATTSVRKPAPGKVTDEATGEMASAGMPAGEKAPQKPAAEKAPQKPAGKRPAKTAPAAEAAPMAAPAAGTTPKKVAVSGATSQSAPTESAATKAPSKRKPAGERPAVDSPVGAPPVGTPRAGDGSADDNPLHKKLGLRAGTAGVVIAPPDGDDNPLLPLPEGVSVLPGLDELASVEGTVDYVQVFARDRGDLAAAFAGLCDKVAPGGSLWISWMKQAPARRGAGGYSDLNETIIRRLALTHGMVDVKIVALDRLWSALRLVRRRH